MCKHGCTGGKDKEEEEEEDEDEEKGGKASCENPRFTMFAFIFMTFAAWWHHSPQLGNLPVRLWPCCIKREGGEESEK